METPYVKLDKINANYFGHMTKMVTTHIYTIAKTLYFSRTRWHMTLGLVIQHLGCGPYHVCRNVHLGLTSIHVLARLNLISNVFY